MNKHEIIEKLGLRTYGLREIQLFIEDILLNDRDELSKESINYLEEINLYEAIDDIFSAVVYLN